MTGGQYINERWSLQCSNSNSSEIEQLTIFCPQSALKATATIGVKQDVRLYHC